MEKNFGEPSDPIGNLGRGKCRLSQNRSHGFLVWWGTIALRAHCRATRSKARLVSKSRESGAEPGDMPLMPFLAAVLVESEEVQRRQHQHNIL